MQAAKVFYFSTNDPHLANSIEKRLNEWLADNPTFKVVDSSQILLPGGTIYHTVFYEKS
jgi:hypothetical protein